MLLTTNFANPRQTEGLWRRNFECPPLPITPSLHNPKVNDSDPIKEVAPFSVPPVWSKAVRVAESLSQDIDYVRVDLYLTETTVYFSELTPYPNGGNVDFLPEELSTWLAALWKADVNHLAEDNFLSTLRNETGTSANANPPVKPQ